MKDDIGVGIQICVQLGHLLTYVVICKVAAALNDDIRATAEHRDIRARKTGLRNDNNHAAVAADESLQRTEC